MTKTPDNSSPQAETGSSSSDHAKPQVSTSSQMARHSSTFSFFAKYQRIILYTAGIFALVSFSITGALQSMFSDMFRPPVQLDTILVSGRTVKITTEDERIATQLARRRQGIDPTVVMPNLIGADRNQDLSRIYAALRRAAISYEIAVSETEVDRAIQEGVDTFPSSPGNPIETHSDLAAVLGYSSLEAYRTMVREAMRIGTLVRLQSLAIDASDAALVSGLLEQQEMIRLSVASLDIQVLEDDLKKTAVSDADLQHWIDELSDGERRSFGFVDSNRAKLRLVVLNLASFDPEPFAEELGERTISDEEVQQHYQMKREEFYKLPEEPKDQPEDGYRALDDALTEEIRRRIQAREIMRTLWGKVQREQGDALLPLNETRTTANQSRLEAQDEVATAQTALDADSESTDLAKALAEAEDRLAAATKTHGDAGEAIDEARAAFDVEAAFKRVLGDRDATVFSYVDSGDEPQTTADLGELPGLGKWTQSWAGTSHQKAGELSSSVQETKTALFHYSVAALEADPLKPFDEIKDEARANYYSQQADEQGKTMSEAFEAALLRLARELRVDAVTELEVAKATELETLVSDWQASTEKRRGDAQAQLAKLPDQESGAYKKWRTFLDGLIAELADVAGKRSGFEQELNTKLEQDIEKEARKAYRDVLVAAAAETGFAVEELISRPRNLISRGSPREIFPATVQFLFFARSGQLAGLEVGDPTDLLEDITNRRYYLAVCVAEEPATLANLTRRDLELGRARAAASRITQGVVQSFSVEALKLRLGLQGPVDTAEIQASAPQPQKEEKQKKGK